MGGFEFAVKEAVSPRLPHVDPQAVEILNALVRPRAPLALTIGGQSRVWHVDRTVEAATLPITLHVTIGAAAARIDIQQETLAALTAHLPLTRPLTECDTELRALWLEYALLEWIEPLEAWLDAPLQLHGDANPAQAPLPTPPLPIHLPLRLEGEGRTYAARLSLSVATAQRLLPLLDTHCPAIPTDWSHLPLALQWVVGHQDLVLADVRRLVPGDVVMLERPTQGMAVVIGGRLLADVNIHAGKLQLLCRPYFLTRGDFNMAQSPTDNGTGSEEDAQAAGAQPRTPALDQLPVRLVCEVGRLELSLGELRELDQGSLLSMSRPVEAAVDIMVNGRQMGRGRLVEIGDGLGVQIVRLTHYE